MWSLDFQGISDSDKRATGDKNNDQNDVFEPYFAILSNPSRNSQLTEVAEF